MPHRPSPPVRRSLAAVAGAGALIAVLAVPSLASSNASVGTQTVSRTTAASTTASTTAPPVVAGSGYLALGDSVTFGYRESDTYPSPDYSEASTFVGYPEYVANALGLNVTNASCPGETSSSFIETTATNNGCEENLNGTPGYRATFPLHVSYSGSQLAFAESFLESHRSTRLVSLMIGGNDVLICDGVENNDGCSSELPAVLELVERNVTTILEGIRDTAGYTGQLVVVNYYSIDSTDPTVNQTFSELDQAIDDAAEPYDVEVARGDTAFVSASAGSAGNSCLAGLLTQLTGSSIGTCGTHPTAAGQVVLAQTVEAAITK